MLILEVHFKQHLEAFASELFIYIYIYILYTGLFLLRKYICNRFTLS